MSELVRTSGHESRDLHNVVFNHFTKHHKCNSTQAGEIERNAQ